jgi:hypothetical protein
VARTTLQWPEFFALPVVVTALGGVADREAQPLAVGLVDFLAAVQRPDGSFDAGFCGDLCQPCNAAFALRPLATAFTSWPESFEAGTRERLSKVLGRAAGACVDGGMNTANHRWVAAGGLAHAARALDRRALARAADEWTRARIDMDHDGAYSEGSPKYAIVSNDAFLDLEEIQGRADLGDLARRSLSYLRTVTLADGDFLAVGSSRYDTDGSSDGYARAAHVFARLGAPDLAEAALRKLWSTRTAPGLVAPCATPPLGEHPKAKLYPSVVSALTAEHLLRWLRMERPGPEPSVDEEPIAVLDRLGASGLLCYRSGSFAAAVGPGPNLFEVRAGEAVIEGARLLGHATGWNRFYSVAQRSEPDGMRLELSTAPGSEEIRLPQYLRAAPEERRPGKAVSALRAELRVSCGPGPCLEIDLEIDGVERANAVLELGARPDQSLFDEDGVVQRPPVAAPAAGRLLVAGRGSDRLVIDHEGGSGHALQLAPYGYGAGDDLWAPSFAPLSLRFGVRLPARLRLRIAAV